jgi:hypothetical protein
MHPTSRHLVRGNHVDAFVLDAVDDKEVDLSCVGPCAREASIRLNALGADLDDAIPQSSGLALGLEESAVTFDDEVVALVYAERQKHAIAALYKLGENRGLGAVANVNRMRG